MSRIFRSGHIAFAMLAIASSTLVFSATAGSHSARSLVTQKIDNNQRFTLTHNVRPELNAKTDLGAVEDSLQIQRMHLVLQRTPEQQADLKTLIDRQHQKGAAEFHKWLTPEQFGERFGASEHDITAISDWLASRGFTVNSVNHANSMVDFSGSAGAVREAFGTELHYLKVNGKQVYANNRDPQVPTALRQVVAGITGLQNIPLQPNHTRPMNASYDKATHKWHSKVAPGAPALARAQYTDGEGDYYLSPQDYYTIYNVNPAFTAGTTGSGATVAVIEQSDINYGTVTGTSAAGGDVATFRTIFGVSGTLNMQVMHGAGTDTCTDPGVLQGDEVEATLDAEWANALAPSATLLFMSCSTADGGVGQSLAAVIDNNLADTMSLSYGETELAFASSDYAMLDTLYAEAATQGQSIFISTGDSGSDVADQNQGQGAVYGLNVNGIASSPYVTATGGTDFQDTYDAIEGGAAQTTYWSATNSSTYGDALSYVPEMAWNDNCASSIFAAYVGSTPAAFCATDPTGGGYSYLLNVIGGSGGFSTHYAVPSYQSGITGYSGTMRAQPDVAMFASNGFWGHALLFCDSDTTDPEGDPDATCTDSTEFGAAGGTSFVAPAMAGIGGLLVNYTGSRQGVLNYTLYALAQAQFTASGTATSCYSNGQTNNTGLTTGLPAASCIFNDVTTSNNDQGCTAGGTDCYVDPGQPYGVLSTTAPSSLTIAYASAPGYDEVSGVGTLNVNNLLTNWNTAGTGATLSLTAVPSTVTVSSPGSSGTAMLTVSGFSSAPALTCTGLPSGATCNFSAIAGGHSTLTITTTAASITPLAKNTPNHRRGSGPVVLAFCLPGFLALAGMAGVRRKSMLSRTLFAVALSFGLAAGITGCGGGGSSSSNSATPAGTSTVTITATAGSQSATATATLTVN